jgi:hypothetical protein
MKREVGARAEVLGAMVTTHLQLMEEDIEKTNTKHTGGQYYGI